MDAKKTFIASFFVIRTWKLFKYFLKWLSISNVLYKIEIFLLKNQPYTKSISDGSFYFLGTGATIMIVEAICWFTFFAKRKQICAMYM